MIYNYYSNIPLLRYTLLTSAAKSVVAWHMFYTASSYSYLIFSSFWLEDLKERWKTNGNVTCYQNPAGLKLVLHPLTAILEFQILRIAFETFPYIFLDINHDFLAYPMAISVPVLALSLKILIYEQQGTLCSLGPETILHNKLNLNITNTNTYFGDNRLDNILYLLIIIFEAFIRIYRFCLRSKRTKRHNKVGVSGLVVKKRSKEAWIEPENIQDRQENSPRDVNITINTTRQSCSNTDRAPASRNIGQRGKLQTSIGPLAPMFFFGIILLLIYKFVSKDYYLASVFYDWYMLGSPFYWIVSSDEIKENLKSKFSQFKTKFGFI